MLCIFCTYQAFRMWYLKVSPSLIIAVALICMIQNTQTLDSNAIEDQWTKFADSPENTRFKTITSLCKKSIINFNNDLESTKTLGKEKLSESNKTATDIVDLADDVKEQIKNVSHKAFKIQQVVHNVASQFKDKFKSTVSYSQFYCTPINDEMEIIQSVPLNKQKSLVNHAIRSFGKQYDLSKKTREILKVSSDNELLNENFNENKKKAKIEFYSLWNTLDRYAQSINLDALDTLNTFFRGLESLKSVHAMAKNCEENTSNSQISDANVSKLKNAVEVAKGLRFEFVDQWNIDSGELTYSEEQRDAAKKGKDIKSPIAQENKQNVLDDNYSTNDVQPDLNTIDNDIPIENNIIPNVEPKVQEKEQDSTDNSLKPQIMNLSKEILSDGEGKTTKNPADEDHTNRKENKQDLSVDNNSINDMQLETNEKENEIPNEINKMDNMDPSVEEKSKNLTDNGSNNTNVNNPITETLKTPESEPEKITSIPKNSPSKKQRVKKSLLSWEKLIEQNTPLISQESKKCLESLQSTSSDLASINLSAKNAIQSAKNKPEALQSIEKQTLDKFYNKMIDTNKKLAENLINAADNVCNDVTPLDTKFETTLRNDPNIKRIEYLLGKKYDPKQYILNVLDDVSKKQIGTMKKTSYYKMLSVAHNLQQETKEMDDAALYAMNKIHEGKLAASDLSESVNKEKTSKACYIKTILMEKDSEDDKRHKEENKEKIKDIMNDNSKEEQLKSDVNLNLVDQKKTPQTNDNIENLTNVDESNKSNIPTNTDNSIESLQDKNISEVNNDDVVIDKETNEYPGNNQNTIQEPQNSTDKTQKSDEYSPNSIDSNINTDNSKPNQVEPHNKESEYLKNEHESHKPETLETSKVLPLHDKNEEGLTTKNSMEPNDNTKPNSNKNVRRSRKKKDPYDGKEKSEEYETEEENDEPKELENMNNLNKALESVNKEYGKNENKSPDHDEHNNKYPEKIEYDNLPKEEAQSIEPENVQSGNKEFVPKHLDNIKITPENETNKKNIVPEIQDPSNLDTNKTNNKSKDHSDQKTENPSDQPLKNDQDEVILFPGEINEQDDKKSKTKKNHNKKTLPTDDEYDVYDETESYEEMSGEEKSNLNGAPIKRMRTKKPKNKNDLNEKRVPNYSDKFQPQELNELENANHIPNKDMNVPENTTTETKNEEPTLIEAVGGIGTPNDIANNENNTTSSPLKPRRHRRRKHPKTINPDTNEPEIANNENDIDGISSEGEDQYTDNNPEDEMKSTENITPQIKNNEPTIPKTPIEEKRDIKTPNEVANNEPSIPKTPIEGEKEIKTPNEIANTELSIPKTTIEGERDIKTPNDIANNENNTHSPPLKPRRQRRRKQTKTINPDTNEPEIENNENDIDGISSEDENRFTDNNPEDDSSINIPEPTDLNLTPRNIVKTDDTYKPDKIPTVNNDGKPRYSQSNELDDNEILDSVENAEKNWVVNDQIIPAVHSEETGSSSNEISNSNEQSNEPNQSIDEAKKNDNSLRETPHNTETEMRNTEPKLFEDPLAKVRDNKNKNDIDTKEDDSKSSIMKPTPIEGVRDIGTSKEIVNNENSIISPPLKTKRHRRRKQPKTINPDTNEPEIANNENDIDGVSSEDEDQYTDNNPDDETKNTENITPQINNDEPTIPKIPVEDERDIKIPNETANNENNTTTPPLKPRRHRKRKQPKTINPDTNEPEIAINENDIDGISSEGEDQYTDNNPDDETKSTENITPQIKNDVPTLPKTPVEEKENIKTPNEIINNEPSIPITPIEEEKDFKTPNQITNNEPSIPIIPVEGETDIKTQNEIANIQNSIPKTPVEGEKDIKTPNNIANNENNTTSPPLKPRRHRRRKQPKTISPDTNEPEISNNENDIDGISSEDEDQYTDNTPEDESNRTENITPEINNDAPTIPKIPVEVKRDISTTNEIANNEPSVPKTSDEAEKYTIIPNDIADNKNNTTSPPLKLRRHRRRKQPKKINPDTNEPEIENNENDIDGISSEDENRFTDNNPEDDSSINIPEPTDLNLTPRNIVKTDDTYKPDKIPTVNNDGKPRYSQSNELDDNEILDSVENAEKNWVVNDQIIPAVHSEETGSSSNEISNSNEQSNEPNQSIDEAKKNDNSLRETPHNTETEMRNTEPKLFEDPLAKVRDNKNKNDIDTKEDDSKSSIMKPAPIEGVRDIGTSKEIVNNENSIISPPLKTRRHRRRKQPKTINPDTNEPEIANNENDIDGVSSEDEDQYTDNNPDDETKNTENITPQINNDEPTIPKILVEDERDIKIPNETANNENNTTTPPLKPRRHRKRKQPKTINPDTIEPEIANNENDIDGISSEDEDQYTDNNPDDETKNTENITPQINNDEPTIPKILVEDERDIKIPNETANNENNTTTPPLKPRRHRKRKQPKTINPDTIEPEIANNENDIDGISSEDEDQYTDNNPDDETKNTENITPQINNDEPTIPKILVEKEREIKTTNEIANNESSIPKTPVEAERDIKIPNETANNENNTTSPPLKPRRHRRRKQPKTINPDTNEPEIANNENDIDGVSSEDEDQYTDNNPDDKTKNTENITPQINNDEPTILKIPVEDERDIKIPNETANNENNTTTPPLKPRRHRKRKQPKTINPDTIEPEIANNENDIDGISYEDEDQYTDNNPDDETKNTENITPQINNDEPTIPKILVEEEREIKTPNEIANNESSIPKTPIEAERDIKIPNETANNENNTTSPPLKPRRHRRRKQPKTINPDTNEPEIANNENDIDGVSSEDEDQYTDNNPDDKTKNTENITPQINNDEPTIPKIPVEDERDIKIPNETANNENNTTTPPLKPRRHRKRKQPKTINPDTIEPEIANNENDIDGISYEDEDQYTDNNPDDETKNTENITPQINNDEPTIPKILVEEEREIKTPNEIANNESSIPKTPVEAERDIKIPNETANNENNTTSPPLKPRRHRRRKQPKTINPDTIEPEIANNENDIDGVSSEDEDQYTDNNPDDETKSTENITPIINNDEPTIPKIPVEEEREIKTPNEIANNESSIPKTPVEAERDIKIPNETANNENNTTSPPLKPRRHRRRKQPKTNNPDTIEPEIANNENDIDGISSVDDDQYADNIPENFRNKEPTYQKNPLGEVNDEDNTNSPLLKPRHHRRRKHPKTINPDTNEAENVNNENSIDGISSVDDDQYDDNISENVKNIEPTYQESSLGEDNDKILPNVVDRYGNFIYSPPLKPRHHRRRKHPKTINPDTYDTEIANNENFIDGISSVDDDQYDDNISENVKNIEPTYQESSLGEDNDKVLPNVVDRYGNFIYSPPLKPRHHRRRKHPKTINPDTNEPEIANNENFIDGISSVDDVQYADNVPENFRNNEPTYQENPLGEVNDEDNTNSPPLKPRHHRRRKHPKTINPDTNEPEIANNENVIDGISSVGDDQYTYNIPENVRNMEPTYQENSLGVNDKVLPNVVDKDGNFISSPPLKPKHHRRRKHSKTNNPDTNEPEIVNNENVIDGISSVDDDQYTDNIPENLRNNEPTYQVNPLEENNDGNNTNSAPLKRRHHRRRKHPKTINQNVNEPTVMNDESIGNVDPKIVDFKTTAEGINPDNSSLENYSENEKLPEQIQDQSIDNQQQPKKKRHVRRVKTYMVNKATNERIPVNEETYSSTDGLPETLEKKTLLTNEPHHENKSYESNNSGEDNSDYTSFLFNEYNSDICKRDAYNKFKKVYSQDAKEIAYGSIVDTSEIRSDVLATIQNAMNNVKTSETFDDVDRSMKTVSDALKVSLKRIVGALVNKISPMARNFLETAKSIKTSYETSPTSMTYKMLTNVLQEEPTVPDSAKDTLKFISPEFNVDQTIDNIFGKPFTANSLAQKKAKAQFRLDDLSKHMNTAISNIDCFILSAMSTVGIGADTLKLLSSRRVFMSDKNRRAKALRDAMGIIKSCVDLQNTSPPADQGVNSDDDDDDESEDPEQVAQKNEEYLKTVPDLDENIPLPEKRVSSKRQTLGVIVVHPDKQVEYKEVTKPSELKSFINNQTKKYKIQFRDKHPKFLKVDSKKLIDTMVLDVKKKAERNGMSKKEMIDEIIQNLNDNKR